MTTGEAILSTEERFLEGTHIEIINPLIQRGRINSALFDFDGTISLIREGWQQVMIPMMVEILMDETSTDETPEALRAIVTEFVDGLTGKQTIYQMLQLREEIAKRGGNPKDALVYKWLYLERLWERIKHRVAGLKDGSISPEDMMLPGSLELLQNMVDRGVTLYLASGTDEPYVKDEANALGVTSFFQGGIFGALDKYENFSKKMLIQNIIKTHNLRGESLVTFGDGFVEIEDAKAVGGIAVGVASDEVKRCGINEWKRNRLIQAGADIIIPEYREYERLGAYLFLESL